MKPEVLKQFKRISPRESVWPTLSLLSLLPPTTATQPQWSQFLNLVTNGVRRAALILLMLMRIWALWVVTNPSFLPLHVSQVSGPRLPRW